MIHLPSMGRDIVLRCPSTVQTRHVRWMQEYGHVYPARRPYHYVIR